jgi:hypothetical protein
MSPSRLVLAAALVLSACASDPAADSSDAGASDEAAAGDLAAGAAGGGEASGGVGCLHGTWAADAERTFRPEVWARLMPPEQGAPEVRFRDASGRALLTFEPDGTLRRRFEDFRVTMDMTMQGGRAVDVAMAMEGDDAARYAVDGDRLTFQAGTGPSGIRGRMTMRMDGRQMVDQAMDAGLFAVSDDTSGVLTYDCRADELLVDVAAPGDEPRLLFDDARYTRVR